MYLYALDYEYVYDAKSGKAKIAIYGKSYPMFEHCIMYVEWSHYVYVSVRECAMYKTDPWHEETHYVQNNVIDAEIQRIKSTMPSNSEVTYEVVSKINGYGYREDEEKFIRVRIADPKLMRAFLRNMAVGTTFSGQIDSIIQFMVDIKSTSWLQFDDAVVSKSTDEGTSHLGITQEFKVWNFKDVRSVPDEVVFDYALATKTFLSHWDFEEECLPMQALLRYVYDNSTSIEEVVSSNPYKFRYQGPTRYALVLTKGPWKEDAIITATHKNWLAIRPINDNELKNEIYYVDLATNRVVCTFEELLLQHGHRKTSFSSTKTLKQLYNNDLSVKFGLTKPLPLPHITVMCFDIECISDDDASFPIARAGDPIIQIACVTVRNMCHIQLDDYAKPHPSISKTIFTIGTCSKIDGVEVVCCQDESALLVAFNNYIIYNNPDVITGYNIIGFDFPYVFQRMEMLRVRQTMSRRKWSRWTCYTKKPTGQIEFFRAPTNEEMSDPSWKNKVYKEEGGGRRWTDEIVLTTPSRIVIDMYKIIQAGQFKLRRETLDAVSSHFLGGETKENVKYKDMFRLFNGTPDDRQKIATYCVQDTMLPLKLMTRLSTMVSTIQFAKVNMIPLRYVHGKGQQIRAFSLILHEARDRNMIFPSFIPFDKDEAFQGATVVQPTTGFYRIPIITLDFASLYPSIIIAYNLCFTTLKLNVSVGELLYHKSPKISVDESHIQNKSIQLTLHHFNIGKKFETNEEDNKRKSTKQSSSKPKKIKTIHGQLRIDQSNGPQTSRKIELKYIVGGDDEFLGKEIISPTGDRFVNKDVRLGIMPKVIVKLLDARREIRKRMARENDPFLKMLLNNQQLAIKCTANSMYGFTGALEKGMLACVQVSRSVTGFGRKLINRTERYVYNYLDALKRNEIDDPDYKGGLVTMPSELEVIYGDTDSVMVKTPKNTSIKDALVWGEKLANWINTHYVRPIELEFEKVYMPYILFTKKRYAGRMFVDPKTPPKIDCKGLENVRRDTCPYVSDVVSECIRLIVEFDDLERAVRYATESAYKLTTKSVPIDKLLMTRALSKKEYAVTMPHVEVVKKIAERTPGSEPRGGERVQFVMKKFTPFETHSLIGTNKVTGNKVKAAYRAEDPAHLLSTTDEEIDYEHYLKMLKPPLLRIFTVALNCSESEAARRIFGKCDSVGYHVPLESSAPMSKFVVRQKRCASCHSILKDTVVGSDECDSCRIKKYGETNANYCIEDGVRAHAQRVLDFLNICKKCVGANKASDISCTNQDCGYFFTRKEAARTMKIKYDGVLHEDCDDAKCTDQCAIKLCRMELNDMLEW
uniref:DNA polymerase n=1 Tax=Ixodes ricinus TaxID=34613 RepID=A0A0K8RKF8_IXORI